MTPDQLEGFADRVAREAQTEAEAVLADLARLRFRADQVVHVLRALKLKVPPLLAAVTSAAEAVEASAPQVAPPTPEEAHVVHAPLKREVRSTEKPKGERGKLNFDRASLPGRLSEMPAAGLSGRLAPKRVRDLAELQLAVLGAALDVGRPFVIAEYKLPQTVTRGRAIDALNALAEQGTLLRRTGVRRRAAGMKTGHPAVEYAAVVAGAPAPAPAPAPTLTEEVCGNKLTPGQQEVLDAVRGCPRRFTLDEAADALPDKGRHSVRVMLGALADLGALLRVGTRGTGGRAKIIYEVAGAEAPDESTFQGDAAAGVAAAQPDEGAAAHGGERPQDDHDAPRGADLLARVRNLVVKQERPFRSRKIATSLDVPLTVAETLLDLLADRKVVQLLHDGERDASDGREWRYERPKDPGPEARMQHGLPGPTGIDMAPLPPSPRRNGGPVPGTGRKPKATDPEVRKLIADLVAAGCPQPTLTGSGHWQVQLSGGGSYTFANTPSSSRAMANARADLRRRGVKV